MFRRLCCGIGLRRGISTCSRLRHQHVMFWGDVLGYSSPSRLSKVSRSWLDEVSSSADVDHGLRFSGLSGGPNHLLLSYTLLPEPLDGKKAPRFESEELSTSQEEDKEDTGVVLVDGVEIEGEGVSKVFALGRNTHAQLGLGFSSQEATRGMVTGEMAGKGGVSKVVAGNGFSFLITSTTTKEEGDVVYGFGNDTLGQLGASPPNAIVSHNSDPYDISTRLDGNAPQLRLLPLPKKVQVDENEGWKVRDLTVGLDHSLILLERELGGYKVQQLLSSGLNTDGQLGLTPKERQGEVPISPLITRHFQRVPIDLPPSAEGEVSAVVCGADTSYALTRGGDVWVWGNSEYGQALAGVHDRIAAPTLVPNPLPNAYSSAGIKFDGNDLPKVKKLVAGGSFAALLDTNGKVWVAGYGPTANPESRADESLAPVQGLDGAVTVEDLYCGLEYVVAITRGEGDELGVWVWGVPPKFVSSMPIETPTKVPYAIPKTPRQQWLDENPRLKKHAAAEEEPEQVKARVTVEHVACTRDHLLVVFNDGRDSHVWAECVQLPKSKGTDMV